MDIIFKFWDRLPDGVKQTLLPVFLAAGVLAIGFWATTASAVNQNVLQKAYDNPYFQFLVLIVVVALTLTYTRGISTPTPALSRLKISGIVTAISLEIVTFFYYQRKPEIVTIYLYQLDSMNYNSVKLTNYIGQINSHQNHFFYILQDEIDGFFPKGNIDTLGVQAFKVASTLRQVVNSNKEITLAKQDVAIAIVPYWLNEDLTHKWLFFSISPDTVHPQYSAISTRDWEFKEFQEISAYKYLIHTSMVVALCGSGGDENPIILHEKGQARGCIFDYMGERLEIVPAVSNPVICQAHQAVIKEYFGSAYLRDALDILNMSPDKKLAARAQSGGLVMQHTF